MKPTALLLLAALFGCASGGPATSPQVTISQASKVAPIRLAELPVDPMQPPSESHGVPVDFEIKVTNPFDYPVSLTSVEVETVGAAGAYSMRRVRHAFSLTINPKSAAVVPIRAWVHPLQATDAGDVNGPVTIGGLASFTSEAGAMKTHFAARVQ
jgi:hypothetical protein